MGYLTGCEKIDVTPPVGTHLAGFAARTEPSTGVYNPLRAVVTAVGDGKTDVILASIEWLGFYDRAEAARAKIEAATGVPSERIFLFGTHTHCGPAMRELDVRRHGASDEAYIVDTLDALAEAAERAMATRRTSTWRFGSDWCGFATSRRKPDGKGGVLWEPSLDAPHDHEVPVIAVETDGDLTQILLSYACHPTSTGPILEIGGDYPGFACDWLEKHSPGATATFLKGCGGDQRTPPADGPWDGFRKLTVDEVRVRGEWLGESARRAIDLGPMQEVEGDIQVGREIVELASMPLDEAEVAEAKGSDRPHIQAWGEHFGGMVARGEATAASTSFEVQTLRFGDSLAIVALAGEMSVEYGIRLKRELSTTFKGIVPLGYANGMVGYVVVDRQIPEGGYEVMTYQHALRTGPFAPGTEDRIVAAVRRGLGC